MKLDRSLSLSHSLSISFILSRSLPACVRLPCPGIARNPLASTAAFVGESAGEDREFFLLPPPPSPPISPPLSHLRRSSFDPKISLRRAMPGNGAVSQSDKKDGGRKEEAERGLNFKKERVVAITVPSQGGVCPPSVFKRQ